MTDLNIDGMALAPGVVETIVFIAANEVEGVASVAPMGSGGLRSMFGAKSATHGVEIDVTADDKLHVALRIEVYYGYVLPVVAAGVRSAVADALSCQVGIPVDSVDIYIDGIQFAD
ncbi:MAG: Asp23/Gls24 family envelope stress response protein [Coriobacteriaceae bacterium]|jgi:uncharacterized alkaline shock family protein YloU|nr:Asp23/Gls24 family envelope stress response protein [Coriobacteriaceae bacterium]